MITRYSLQTQDDNGDDCEGYLDNSAEGDLVKFEDYEKLQKEAKALLAVLEAHEVDSLDCDRRGEKYCNCLSKQIERLKALT